MEIMQEIPLSFDVPLPASVFLHAGRLSCFYEEGKLRYIKSGEEEIVRMIYPAVRDDQWKTLTHVIRDEKIVHTTDSFFISYTAVFEQEAAMYQAAVEITGTEEGSIVFSMKGKALLAFRSNRIGLCLLHPLKACTGRSVLIRQPDGSVYQSAFPALISPHQPFLNVNAMRWTTEHGQTVQLYFSGDIFETEDQRNWSDASFKTYSTPLHIPFPVSVLPGNTMSQEISLQASGMYRPALQNETADPFETKIPFPVIGYSRSPGHPALSTEMISLLRQVPFHHYHVRTALSTAAWQSELKAALAEAILLNTRLELAVIFPENFEPALKKLLERLEPHAEQLRSLLVLQEHEPVCNAALLQQLYPVLKSALPLVMIGYGTEGSFVDLNRHPPPDISFDFCSCSLYPKVHASDSLSIMENLQSQPDIVATAATFCKGKPLFISPISLAEPSSPSPDPRQATGMAAMWTALSLHQLGAAASLTYYTAHGPTGLLHTVTNENGEAMIQPTPVFHLLTAIQSFQPLWIITSKKTGPDLPEGLLLENGKGERLFFNTGDWFKSY